MSSTAIFRRKPLSLLTTYCHSPFCGKLILNINYQLRNNAVGVYYQGIGLRTWNTWWNMYNPLHSAVLPTLCARPNVTTHTMLTHFVLSHTLLNYNLVSFAYRSIYCVTYCTAYSYTLFNRNDCIRCVVLFMSVYVLYVPVERIWVFCLVLGMVVT
jgi:hypothetical protein